MTKSRRINGDDLLYRFFQDTLAEHPEIFAAVPQLLLTSMGVWLPVEVYSRLPVLLPWVVRDPSCRGNPRKGIPDSWSAPNERGFLRDDNSMIKGLPRSLRISGPERSSVRGARMGSEFVASHVWREVETPELASRHHLLNSFVPNLVWLPAQIAKLTDREGGVVQKTLQAMSYQIYRHAPVHGPVAVRAEEAWGLIQPPNLQLAPFSADDLNWFVSTPAFVETRVRRIESVLEALDRVSRRQAIAEKSVSTRYAAGLPAVNAEAREELATLLADFVASPE